MRNLGDFLVAVIFAIILSDVTGSEDDLIVSLANPNGKIRGHILKSEEGADFYAFQEIPYASPPLGELRFQAPRKVDDWEGILKTTENTRICPQIIPTDLPQNEDCLYLNVYTPVKPSSNKKLAVYVWIHGGAFFGWDGTINRYGPKYLMDYNIVVVTLNYRLGAFGFLTDNLLIPGNIGLRDQRLALKWVQDNIHRFGGDPKKVTIGGQSAGASSVSMHILSPLSKGLFRGAIQESGSALCTFSYQPNAYYYAFELGRLLDSNLKNGNSTRLLEVLRHATVTELLEAQTKIVNLAQWISVLPDFIWTPVIETTVDKEQAFSYEYRHEAFIKGDFNKVPILLGVNTKEMIFFITGSIYNTVPSVQVGLDQINNVIVNLDGDSSQLINNKFNILDNVKAKVGSLLKKTYSNTTFINDKPAYVEFSGDIFFNIPTIRQAQLTSKYISNVYLYQFAYTPFTNKTITQGSEHTEELQYLWENIKEDPGYVNDFQKTLRRQMLKLWTNFIKLQNPTPSKDNELYNTTWPFVEQDKIQYLNINEKLEILSNPKNYLQKSKILNEYMKPPFIVS